MLARSGALPSGDYAFELKWAIEPWIGVDDLALVLGGSTDWVYEKAACGEPATSGVTGRRSVVGGLQEPGDRRSGLCRGRFFQYRANTVRTPICTTASS
jgi:hypothetical protein